MFLTFGGFLAVALVNTTLRASPDCARAAATNSSNTSRRSASLTAAARGLARCDAPMPAADPVDD
ncbi:MAG TPA: hypothetical protein VF916_05580, partial [Ktedonobacterales bacterium]